MERVSFNNNLVMMKSIATNIELHDKNLKEFAMKHSKFKNIRDGK